MAIVSSITRLLGFLATSALLVSAGVWAVFTYLPHATITLTPHTMSESVSRDITLQSSATEPDFQRGVLPARVIEATAEENVVIRREHGSVTHGLATGVVRLTNNQDEEQPLLPKTHLRHEETGAFFLTDRAIRLPVQGSAEITVTAKEEGPRGDVPPGKFAVDRLPANLQDAVFGESLTPFTGGEVFDSPLGEEEIAAARDAVAESARRTALEDLRAQVGDGLLREDLTTTTIEDSFVSAEPGSSAASMAVRVKVIARAFIVDENDLLGFTALELQHTESGDLELVTYDPQSFETEIVRADFERGDAVIATRVTGHFAHRPSQRLFAPEPLVGRTPEEVTTYFAELDEKLQVDVNLSPAWVTTVPARTSAIDIRVDQ